VIFTLRKDLEITLEKKTGNRKLYNSDEKFQPILYKAACNELKLSQSTILKSAPTWKRALFY